MVIFKGGFDGCVRFLAAYSSFFVLRAGIFGTVRYSQMWLMPWASMVYTWSSESE